jgi:UDP-2,3-diacylglucosamine hydrolase
MPHSLFISDLHLDATRPEVTQALARFLAQSQDCEALYVLGDLFEAWVGDDDDTPLSGEVRALLRNFSASGPALFLMQGNRDFLLGETFCRAVGGKLLPDPVAVDLYGRRTLLMHGDSLCTADTDYLKFRAAVRDPTWQAELLGRSLNERRNLAQNIRGISRAANSNKAEDIMDVTGTEVARVMARYRADCLIHGHTHRPARHRNGGRERWVLGDWDQLGWAITASPKGIELNSFIINQ